MITRIGLMFWVFTDIHNIDDIPVMIASLTSGFKSGELYDVIESATYLTVALLPGLITEYVLPYYKNLNKEAL